MFLHFASLSLIYMVILSKIWSAQAAGVLHQVTDGICVANNIFNKNKKLLMFTCMNSFYTLETGPCLSWKHYMCVTFSFTGCVCWKHVGGSNLWDFCVRLAKFLLQWEHSAKFEMSLPFFFFGIHSLTLV